MKAVAIGAVAALFALPCALMTFNGQLRGSVESTGLNAGVPNADETIWSPDKPGAWETQAYEAMMQFQMPYMEFTEEVYVFSDAKKGYMRLSYYSGANVILINTTGSSFELVPVAEKESCLITSDVHKLELVIPELSLFREKGTHRRITLADKNGGESVGYEFIMRLEPLHSSEDGDWSYFTPTQGFVGVYKFVVNATAGGTPVSLTFRGHNPFLVQSHDDEYRIVYEAFHPRPEGIDRSFFTPPVGMPCTPYQNPTGPFATRRPMRDFSMYMPGLQGDAHRHEALNDMFTHFNKTCNSSVDCASRQQLALRHFRWVQAANRRGRNYTVGLNHMLDWSREERYNLLGRRKTLDIARQKDSCGIYEREWSSLGTLPERIDWREHGLVGPPRDQGTCGSCWAFGAIGSLEGQLWKDGPATRLSEQHLLDCSWGFGNNACDGGNDANAFSWLLQNNGGLLPTADTYGFYLSMNGFCHFDKSNSLEGLKGVAAPPPGAKMHIEVAAQVKSCWHVAGPDQGGTQAAVNRLGWALVSVGPLSTSVMASRDDFYYYQAGVYDNPECVSTSPDLDHIVLLVGYGRSVEYGEEYWLIRNSWSTHWGEGGYIRIAKRNNTCGISTQAAFALL